MMPPLAAFNSSSVISRFSLVAELLVLLFVTVISLIVMSRYWSCGSAAAKSLRQSGEIVSSCSVTPMARQLL
jgi:hypothetical protein